MNNLMKAREIIWFLVGITGMMLAFYTYYHDDKRQAVIFLIISITGAFMLYLRRKQRKELESEDKK